MKKNIFSKTIAILASAAVLSVAGAAMTASASATPSVTLSSVTAKAGETVTISMGISDNSDFALKGFGGVISYDSALTFEEASKYSSPMMDMVSVSNAGTIAVGASSMEGTADNGTIVDLQFTVPADAEPGTTYAISWDTVKLFKDVAGEDKADSVGKVDGLITVEGEETTVAEETTTEEETTVAEETTTAAGTTAAETTAAPKATTKATTKAVVKESPKTGSTGIAATAAVLLAAACSAVVLKKKNK